MLCLRAIVEMHHAKLESFCRVQNDASRRFSCRAHETFKRFSTVFFNYSVMIHDDRMSLDDEPITDRLQAMGKIETEPQNGNKICHAKEVSKSI